MKRRHSWRAAQATGPQYLHSEPKALEGTFFFFFFFQEKDDRSSMGGSQALIEGKEDHESQGQAQQGR